MVNVTETVLWTALWGGPFDGYVVAVRYDEAGPIDQAPVLVDVGTVFRGTAVLEQDLLAPAEIVQIQYEPVTMIGVTSRDGRNSASYYWCKDHQQWELMPGGYV